MPKNNKEDSRLREIAALVARHRLHQGITPQKLRALVEDLGPTYVKLGQILSLRQDLLPEEYCRELARLQVQARPMPFDHRRKEAKEAGRPLPLHQGRGPRLRFGADGYHRGAVRGVS